MPFSKSAHRNPIFIVNSFTETTGWCHFTLFRHPRPINKCIYQSKMGLLYQYESTVIYSMKPQYYCDRCDARIDEELKWLWSLFTLDNQSVEEVISLRAFVLLLVKQMIMKVCCTTWPKFISPPPPNMFTISLNFDIWREFFSFF